MQILTHKPEERRFDFRTATVWAAKMRKVSAWRIALEVVLLARGQGKLSAEEYFQQGAWRPGLTWAERREFLGRKSVRALNTALNPPPEWAALQRLGDKIISQAWLKAAGVPVPNRIAVAAVEDPKAGVPWLGSREAILEFLSSPGSLPCFGKPAHSSIGRGAVRLMGFTDAGEVRIGADRIVAAEALAAEIWSKYQRGYIFEELMEPHSGVAAMIGPVIGTLRVTTINTGAGPEVLYTALRGPAEGATVDSSSGPLGILLTIDPVTGQILRMQDRRSLGGLDLAASPITGRALVGEVLPDFPAALDAALSAHRALPERGIVGTDVMLSTRGPVVGEVNSNPHHSVYQTAFARGLLNRDILPKLLAVRARFKDSVPLPRGCPLK